MLMSTHVDVRGVADVPHRRQQSKTDNKGGLMLVKTAKRVRNAVIFVALVVAVGLLAFYVTGRHGMEHIHEDADRRLEGFSNALFAPTDKYSYLPDVVANHPIVIEALLDKRDPARQARANAFLDRLNAAAKTATIYVTDDDGMTIAASNWQHPEIFAGRSFSFRPYFIDAIRAGTGRFYGLGTLTFAPGYYISHHIKQGSNVLGVAVVKIDLTNLDEKWDREHGEMTVSDANGVMFLSSRKDWKYQPTQPLQRDAMEKLVRTRQYEGVLKEALSIVTVKTLGPDARVVKVAEPVKNQDGQQWISYLVKSRRLPEADWTIDAYIPLKAHQTRAIRSGMITGGAFAFVLLLILYLRQTSLRIKERERSRAALEGANQQLEVKNRELQSVSDALHRISITDDLTSTYNRRFFFESLTKLMSAAKRHGTPLSIIMIDVDNFKQINDSYGHPVGDEVLQGLAGTCHEALREADVFARFGGEEFIVALPDTDAHAAREVAERLRLAAMSEPVDAGGVRVCVTISCGISQYRPSDVTIQEMIKRADQALYSAKNSGRNQVVVN
jgi:two-component system C4-dicarboxylate transport sensor histidine kinase DctB